jgi:predicted transcriptional regulator
MRMGCSFPRPIEISLTPDLEDKLSRLASTDAWFVAQVDKGLAQVEAGRTLSHEVVGRRVKARISAKLSAA